MKEDKSHIIFIVVIILLMAVGIIGAFCEAKIDDELWNDGYCSECGCPWCYQDMYHIKNSGDIYIYADKEGHTIEIHTNHGFGVDNR
jgi:hypothetical protein